MAAAAPLLASKAAALRAASLSSTTSCPSPEAGRRQSRTSSFGAALITSTMGNRRSDRIAGAEVLRGSDPARQAESVSLVGPLRLPQANVLEHRLQIGRQRRAELHPPAVRRVRERDARCV